MNPHTEQRSHSPLITARRGQLRRLLIAVCAIPALLGADLALATPALANSGDSSEVAELVTTLENEQLSTELVVAPDEELLEVEAQAFAIPKPREADTDVQPQDELEADPSVEPTGAPADAVAQEPAAAAPAQDFVKMRSEIVRLTNVLRAKKGVAPLKADTQLHSVAKSWSVKQAKANHMSHNPSIRTEVPSGWDGLGENVAHGYTSAESVVNAWRDSPTHYANIMRSDVSHIGIGIATASNDWTYFTQVFAGYPNGLATPGVFLDVSPGAKFYKEIAWMKSTGLSTGVQTPAGHTYQPKTSVSREAMAAFLYRLNTPKGASQPTGFTIPKSSPFADVPTTHKFFKEIAWMASSGISTGIAQRGGMPIYAPKSAVSREAMAAFLSRMETSAAYKAPKQSRFADVSTGHKFYQQISWMHESGLSTGVRQASGNPVYQPKMPVTREAMAAFLYRLKN